ncbi:MAG: TIGR03960 family B12-binding radical SAM protein [Clostridia bacterium]|nr:TIGR03960 family B12-binding radical SAM protein [Clostridia bacterium]
MAKKVTQHILTKEIEQDLLPYINKPAQYLGGEFNSIKKEWDTVKARVAFCFPDTYEIGMSHLGLRVLYQVVNEKHDYLMERSFAPMTDMEELMRAKEVPLFSWESYTAIKDFDFVAFTLQYEMSYTNILNMLDLAGLPIEASARSEGPIVIAGGPGAYNPEPLVDFIDLFVLGEGEEAIIELLDLWMKVKAAGGNKLDYLKAATAIEGVYVPLFYKPVYAEAGKLVGMQNEPFAPPVIQKRLIRDVDNVSFPTDGIVPFTQVVHDRVMLEVMRGCNRGCRFCQAGIIYRPVREKSMEVLLEQADKAIAATGYDEIGMISLSTADYSCVGPLIDELMARYAKEGVSVSLPSLRADAFSVSLAEKVQRVRKSGLTFAPEAGSQRLRDIINKGVCEADIMQAVASAFAQGWNSIKLYFMMGLPGETLDDLEAIAYLTKDIIHKAKEVRPEGSKKPINITVSVAVFVPKPHTPFQWYGQEKAENIRKRQSYLRDLFRSIKQARLVCHDSPLSFLEAVFSRGDRKLNQVLKRAWQLGCKFDGWSEHFDLEKWNTAFRECGIVPEDYANRDFAKDDYLPWQHMSSGVSVKWLWHEWEKAKQALVTDDCRHGKCSGCGVCTAVGCDNIYLNSAEK